MVLERNTRGNEYCNFENIYDKHRVLQVIPFFVFRRDANVTSLGLHTEFVSHKSIATVHLIFHFKIPKRILTRYPQPDKRLRPHSSHRRMAYLNCPTVSKCLACGADETNKTVNPKIRNVPIPLLFFDTTD